MTNPILTMAGVLALASIATAVPIPWPVSENPRVDVRPDGVLVVTGGA